MRQHAVVTPGRTEPLVGRLAPERFFGWCERLTVLLAGVGRSGRRAERADALLAGVGRSGRHAERAEAVLSGVGRAGRPAERADAVLSLLASSWGRAYAAGEVDRRAWDAALAGADTFAVAHVLARSALPAVPLADLVDRVLVAWCFGESPCTIERLAPAHQRTPEVLLGALTQQPSAARRLLAEWEDEALDLLIGWDPDAAGPMLVAASTGDPGADHAETGRLLGKVLEYLWANPADAERAASTGTRLVDWLGAVIGPWQLHLLARSPGWEWPALDARAVLAWIASSPDAADALAVTWAEQLR